MKVLIVHDDDATVAALARAVRARNAQVHIEHEGSLASVDVLLTPSVDDVLQFAAYAGWVQRQGVRVIAFRGIECRRGLSRAVLETLANFNPLTPVPRAPVLRRGAVETRVDVLEYGTPEVVADQLLLALGVARSATVDVEVLESMGSAGAADFKKVRWPGLEAPVLLVEARPDSFRADSLPLAARASLVRGPGLAETLEVFWEDPTPHLLQVLPPGCSLASLRPGYHGPSLGVPMALSVVRGLAEGVATLHAHGFASGGFEISSVWLTFSGEVLLLGRGMVHLRLPEMTTYSWAAPEEIMAQVPAAVPGDAFRLGSVLLDLAVGESPYGQDIMMQLEWSIEHSNCRRELEPIAGVLETLLHLTSADRPRGELLHEVIATASPSNWKEYVAKFAKGQ